MDTVANPVFHDRVKCDQSVYNLDNDCLLKRWLPYNTGSSRNITHRLFCFPFAGGGASAFQALRHTAPGWLDVQPVQLPGRESRFSEAPLDSLDAIIAGLREVLAPFAHQPYSLLGYSLGAHLARALAGDFMSRRLPLPEKLILAARRAPSAPSRAPSLHRLPSGQFWQRLAQYEGTPAEVLANPDLREILEPMLRADFAVSDSPFPSSGPVPSSIIALAGSDDPFAAPDEMAGWARETSGAFKLIVVEGSHFFLRNPASPFCCHVVGQFADCAPQHFERAATPSAVHKSHEINA